MTFCWNLDHPIFNHSQCWHFGYRSCSGSLQHLYKTIDTCCGFKRSLIASSSSNLYGSLAMFLSFEIRLSKHLENEMGNAGFSLTWKTRHCDIYVGSVPWNQSGRTGSQITGLDQLKPTEKVFHSDFVIQYKMAAILQMTFSNAFSCAKIIVFLFKFHWGSIALLHVMARHRQALPERKMT